MAHVRRKYVTEDGKRKLYTSHKFPKGVWEARWKELDPTTGKLAWRGHSCATKAEAERYASTTAVAMDRGEHVGTKLAKTPFGTLAHGWLTSLRDIEPTTYHCYESALRNHVLPAFGPRPVGTITFTDVNAWVSRLSETSNPPTVRGAYRVARLVLQHAVRAGCLRSNPATGVSLPKQRRLDDDELTALILDHREVTLLAETVDELWLKGQAARLGRLPTLPQPAVLPYGLMVRFAAYTGLRADEIAALRVKHLDLKGQQVRVVGKVLSATLAEDAPGS